MPTDREELRARLRALFVEELEEHVLVLNRGLLALEQGEHAEELVNDLFRSAHSLKGAAQSAGIPPAEAVCHRLEDALARLRDGTLTADEASLQPLFAAVDALADTARQMRAGEEPTQAGVADVLEGLARLVAGDRPARSAVAPPPPQRPTAPAPPAPPPPAPPRPAPSRPAPAHQERPAPDAASVRLSPAKLEALLTQAGELLSASSHVHTVAAGLGGVLDVVAEQRTALTQVRALAGTSHERGASDERLSERLAIVERISHGLAERLDGLARAAAQSDRAIAHAGQAVVEGARAATMLPFAQACEGVDRVLRDVGAAEGKQARLVVEGADVELDRPIITGLREPLLHLIRNAVHHGIERPDERAARGKPAVGVVTVTAALQSDGVEVSVADDGAGIDVASLRSAAQRRGVDMSEADPLELVFAPGVSTAPLVTEVSGRGVGMDAVRARGESLGGSVRVESRPGAGTVVTLRLPLTLSTLRVLLARTAGTVVALPTSAIVRLLRAPVDDLRVVEGEDTLVVDGRSLRVVSLARAVGAAEGYELVPGATFAAAVVDTAGREAVLVVDELLAETEVVMKPLGPRLAGLQWALGNTLLSDGRVAFILNAAACIRTRVGHGVAVAARDTDARARKRILLAEDTFTTRALERSILEAAGYEVRTAVDGLEAWQLLQEEGADLVVSDVQMPRMDGFALCEAIRASARFRDVPVMLVTSLSSDEDRRRGIEVGANAYIVKSAFEQPVLLETIERLV